MAGKESEDAEGVHEPREHGWMGNIHLNYAGRFRALGEGNCSGEHSYLGHFPSQL